MKIEIDDDTINRFIINDLREHLALLETEITLLKNIKRVSGLADHQRIDLRDDKAYRKAIKRVLQYYGEEV